ncbi:Protein of unknown function [Gryllus bimaculatus]|nr:Protein of unknown function [Gryllus bimaculatus]
MEGWGEGESNFRRDVRERFCFLVRAEGDCVASAATGFPPLHRTQELLDKYQKLALALTRYDIIA